MAASAPEIENLQRCLRLVSDIRAHSGALWQAVARGARVGAQAQDDGGGGGGADGQGGANGGGGANSSSAIKTNVGPAERRFLSDLKALLDSVGANIK